MSVLYFESMLLPRLVLSAPMAPHVILASPALGTRRIRPLDTAGTSLLILPLLGFYLAPLLLQGRWLYKQVHTRTPDSNTEGFPRSFCLSQECMCVGAFGDLAGWGWRGLFCFAICVSELKTIRLKKLWGHASDVAFVPCSLNGSWLLHLRNSH